MHLPEYSGIDTLHLQRLFDNMSECYKLFWFKAIVESVMVGKKRVSFGELIDTMIADAWYMVSEYRLNLGPADTLEALVHHAFRATGLKSSEKREAIIAAVASSKDKELLKMKQVLTYNVPYRLQAPFLPNLKGDQWSGAKTDLAARINSQPGLIYRFISISGMDSLIEVTPDWASYIKNNFEIIQGWIHYNLIAYLQRRNPSVPGIPNKIFPPQERKLEKVKKLWKTILTVAPVTDIYGGIELDASDISIDHFVPWSYVAHDELWNLNPTTRSINSSKSNHLPDWDIYFSRLCEIQYHAYDLMLGHEVVHREFEKCVKDHINSSDIMHKLYRPNIKRSEFYNNLEEIILPVYTAAQNMGFDRWSL